MAAIPGQIGELSFTLQVTRKDTGKVEEYQMVGVVTDGMLEQPPEEKPQDPQPPEKE